MLVAHSLFQEVHKKKKNLCSFQQAFFSSVLPCCTCMTDRPDKLSLWLFFCLLVHICIRRHGKPCRLFPCPTYCIKAGRLLPHFTSDTCFEDLTHRHTHTETMTRVSASVIVLMVVALSVLCTDASPLCKYIFLPFFYISGFIIKLFAQSVMGHIF